MAGVAASRINAKSVAMTFFIERPSLLGSQQAHNMCLSCSEVGREVPDQAVCGVVDYALEQHDRVVVPAEANVEHASLIFKVRLRGLGVDGLEGPADQFMRDLLGLPDSDPRLSGVGFNGFRYL